MSGPYRFALVAEDRRGAESARRLADRVLVEPPPPALTADEETARLRETLTWLTPEVWLAMRSWGGLEPATEWMDFKAAVRRALALKLPVRGQYNGLPGQMDADLVRAALLLYQRQTPRPHVVVLARDLGGEARRKAGFQQALADRPWSFQVVFALAQPEAEAWYLAGFDPASPEEHAFCEELRQKLGFHVHQQPGRLKEGRTHHERDAKGVFERLAQVCRLDEHTLEVRCLGTDLFDEVQREALPRGASLPVLLERGSDCGLFDYLRDVLAALVRVVTSPSTEP